ncbi:MAG: 2OG-Fe dioxygenase family protein [Thiolinea sp.]
MNPLLTQPGYLIATSGQNNALQMRLQQRMAQAFARFCRSWSQLLPDPYLRDGGRYRLRRYSVFHWEREQLTRLPYEPHYQSSYHNAVHGGFNRHFRSWLPTTVFNPVLREIIRWSIAQFSTHPAHRWRIQAHQFRIVASAQEEGRPTPEGVHKDGADYILIMLLDRQNVQGGVSHIYDNAMQPLEQCQMRARGDLLLVNDREVYHGVTPILPEDASRPAWRDVLVLTFHRQ